MAVIYILLIISTGKKYLPRWNPIVIAVTVFTGLYALTSFTGVDFNYSFWGTLERMGGLFSFLHFWVFFIILISIFRNYNTNATNKHTNDTNNANRDWMKLLKLSVVVGFLSILFAYGQHFKLGNFFIGWQHGSRVIGTIGNPALHAGYLLFILFLSIYFILKKGISAREKSFFSAVFILGVPVLHMTAVRGSIIAFWGGLFLLGAIYLIFSASAKATADKPKNKKVKLYIFIGLFIFLLIIGFIWINRDSAWVKDIKWLNRITTISLETTTLQTRLWSWHSGLQGFKERPILGWGPENFVLAHAKYFDARHFKGMGSETIWDRAHNIVLEMLTTMGIIGLLSYLSIFASVFWLLVKRFKKKKIELATFAVFGVMLIVYWVHNLFIFDTMANYLMFFIVIGYISYHYRGYTQIKTQIDTEEISVNPRINQRKSASTSNPLLIFILVVGAVLLIYKTNIEPAMANYACTRAILAGRAGNVQEAFDKYQEALSYKTYQGKYEFRHRLATFAIQYNQNLYQKKQQVNQEMLNYTIEELEKNIKAHPLDYVPHLYLGRMYSFLIKVESKEKSEWAGEKAEQAVMSALVINDKNPRVWYEVGQVELFLKKYDEAVEAFERALELNPDVTESLWFLGMSYAKLENTQEAIKYVEKAIEKGYNYKNSITNIVRLIDLYNKTGNYYEIIDLYKAAIKLQPQNAQFYASLAVAYKVVGDIENAILHAQKAIEIDENFREEAEKFINSLK